MSMTHDNTNLHEKFCTALAEFYDAEKKLNKVTLALSEAAVTPELRKALTPTETDAEAHANRLVQLMKSLKVKTAKTTSIQVEALLSSAKRLSGKRPAASVGKDVSILAVAKQIEHHRIACYQLLLVMSKLLELELGSTLLEQSLADHLNTDSYLTQVAQNALFTALIEAPGMEK